METKLAAKAIKVTALELHLSRLTGWLRNAPAPKYIVRDTEFFYEKEALEKWRQA